MQLNLRVPLIVSIMVLTASMLPAHAVSDGPPDGLASVESFSSIADSAGAFGGDIHGTRQGADPSALSELPSRRRPPAPRRYGAAPSAAGRARR